MPNQFNASIANQTVVFRGTSTIDVKANTVNFPNVRAIAGAAYVLRVTGGVSGNFGCIVLGRIGDVAGSTVMLSGITNVSAAGTYILTPFGYSGGATGTLLDPTSVSIKIDQIVPPSHVVLQATAAPTAGISANCSIAAALWVG